MLVDALSEIAPTQLVDLSYDASMAAVLFSSTATLSEIESRLLSPRSGRGSPFAMQDKFLIVEVAKAKSSNLTRVADWLSERLLFSRR